MRISDWSSDVCSSDLGSRSPPACSGFNLADVPDAALSVVVVTDGDSAGAQAMTDELLTDAWAARADFSFESEPLADSVARAKQLASDKGPVFLLDHCANSASGGTMATTAEIGRAACRGRVCK